MSRTKLLEILFVVTAGLGMIFVGWAVLVSSTPTPTLTMAATATSPAPTPTPTAPPTDSPTPSATPQPITLTILHTNDTWGYVLPCG
ncbi:MAG: hypothetical protein SVX38_02015 [Chloroflexota bacterium]|nr:hypothetical protein [Chloroflexota bacterium]